VSALRRLRDAMTGWTLALALVALAQTVLPVVFATDDLGGRLGACPSSDRVIDVATAWAGLGPNARSPIAGCSTAAAILLPRVPWSALPFLLACAVSLPFASALGLLGAWRRGRTLDRGVTAFVVALHAIPGVAVALWIQAGVRAVGLPGLGAGALDGRGFGASVIGPTLTLACGLLPGLTRLSRAGWCEVLGAAWWATARDEGRATLQLALRFGTSTALHAPVQQLAWAAPRWIVGAAVVETVFGWPGVGSVLARHAAAGDAPVVAFGVTMAAGFAAIASWVAPTTEPER
jgi:peptide/nickel transport system permease protein